MARDDGTTFGSKDERRAKTRTLSRTNAVRCPGGPTIEPKCTGFAHTKLWRKKNGHDHSERWDNHLLQRLGNRSGRNVFPRLAPELRCLGRPDAVSQAARLSLYCS